jgi:hypothetical protein
VRSLPDPAVIAAIHAPIGVVPLVIAAVLTALRDSLSDEPRE